MSLYELFITKCTKCHGKEQAWRHHESKTFWISTVRRMKMEHGVKLSDEESDSIADLPGEPDRQVFEDNCSRCHPIDRVSSCRKADS